MRTSKLISYFIVAVSMNYYRLLKSQAMVQFNNNTALPNAAWPDMIPYGVEHLWIPTDSGEDLSAWLVMPKGKYMLQDDPFPIVIMAPGFGNQKDMGLLPFAEAFSDRGIAALMIDYRSFGGSSRYHWKMRNYVNPWWHVEDIVTTVHFVRSHNGFIKRNIDVNKIALWGAAYGGGHVLVAAERLGPISIRGVISQAPFLDGRKASWNSLRSGFLRFTDFFALAATDYIRSKLWMSPMYVKIISDQKKDISYITTSPEDLQRYYSKHPKKYLGGWENKAPARSFFSLSFYSPAKYVENVKVLRRDEMFD